jgi:hypothetical protein
LKNALLRSLKLPDRLEKDWYKFERPRKTKSQP